MDHAPSTGGDAGTKWGGTRGALTTRKGRESRDQDRITVGVRKATSCGRRMSGKPVVGWLKKGNEGGEESRDFMSDGGGRSLLEQGRDRERDCRRERGCQSGRRGGAQGTSIQRWNPMSGKIQQGVKNGQTWHSEVSEGQKVPAPSYRAAVFYKRATKGRRRIHRGKRKEGVGKKKGKRENWSHPGGSDFRPPSAGDG